ncbi:DUF1847 domain-containing protein [Desulfosarcina ovata]|uniref:Metal-binding protein n=2 Tax=Desulfosarcina ovata TaxID=83564 RepID=A0A5K8AFU9_9BACT|nr:DUF1847 domain-containing protein [Desulfosarcina ovata]BBO82795.1 hypothetical protein DSCO28_33610 [Desulfosarcina ovata subsp. sediminis]BBO91481.1 hypothetical protein DSCOOX_46610 [Desulfosarcina ovata subsp. ovata]
MQAKTPDCARCPYKISERLCRTPDGKSPDFCPTRHMSDLVEQSLEEYDHSPGILEFAQQASIQEGEGYRNRELGYENVRGAKTRIEEIMEFATKMNYHRLGLAFCLGLRQEAKIVGKLFSSVGFDMVSVVCKAGRIPKERLGLDRAQQIDASEPESMCNPILQAMVLNKAETEFNVLLGLCVGHDSLFFKYAQAPCTVLAVKDRVLGHNPLAAVYNLDSYYRSLKRFQTRTTP